MAKNLFSAFAVVLLSVGFVVTVSATTAKQAPKVVKMAPNDPPYNGR